MILQDVRNYYTEQLSTGFATYATGLLSLLEKLGPNFFDAYDLEAQLVSLRLGIPGRKGGIVVYFDAHQGRYYMEAHSDPSGDMIESCSIWNIDNPVTELEEFIERAKPKMEVGWKG